MANARKSATRGQHESADRFLLRNTFFNIAGLGTPVLFALFAYPLLYENLGTERFGALQLFQLVGGISLFDIGLSRALTRLVATRIADRDTSDLPHLIWTSLLLMSGFGLTGTIACWFAAPSIIPHLGVSPGLEAEATQAFKLIGVAFLFIGSSAGLRGVLEAHSRFDISNALRAPLGILIYAAPLGAIPFSRSLVLLAAIMVAVRAISCVAHLSACLRIMPDLRSPKISWSQIPALIHFGAWMTVSNVISPIMVSMDRFLIAGLFTLGTVSFYAAPYDIITRALLLASAMSATLFPKLAGTFQHEKEFAATLVRKATTYLATALSPGLIIVILFSGEGLTLWMGEEFAMQSAPVLQILALGVLANALAHGPFAFVQASGRPDLTAKLHLAELPFYVASVFLLAGAFGLPGVAAAWTLRCSADALVLYIITWRSLPSAKPTRATGFLLVTTCTMGVAEIVIGLPLLLRVGLGASLVTFYAFCAQRFVASRGLAPKKLRDN